MPDDPARRDSSERFGAVLYRYRVWLLCVGIFALMSALSPTFRTAANMRTILKAAGENLPAAIGFTLVLICGQLDLSVGSAMTMVSVLPARWRGRNSRSTSKRFGIPRNSSGWK